MIYTQEKRFHLEEEKSPSTFNPIKPTHDLLNSKKKAFLSVDCIHYKKYDDRCIKYFL